MIGKIKEGFPRWGMYALTLIYLEVIFQWMVFGRVTWGMLYGSLFGISVAVLSAIISGLGPRWFNKAIATVLLVFLEILFVTQRIYYDIFKTFLSFFSITNGTGNAVEFSEIIIDSLGKIWWQVLLLLLPLIVYFAWWFWGGHLSFQKNGWKKNLIMAAVTLAGYGVAIGLLWVPGTGTATPHDAFFEKPVMAMRMRNLGVLVSMRQDVQETLFHSEESGLSLSTSSESSQEESVQEESSSAEQSHEESSEESQAEEVFVPEPNILEIDFDQLIKEAPNETIVQMHQYFQSVEPTYTNEYTGMFEGYNLILITAEAFSSWAIDEELTPTLYKMANSSFVFHNFYTPYFTVSTSDGEYVTHTSLLPKENVWSYYWSSYNEMPFGFGNLFGGLGYTCYGYHNHDYDYYDRDLSHPNMGYIWKGYGNGLNVDYTWPESDLQMMELTIPDYIDQEPFHTYYLTVSGHQLWNFIGNMMSMKHQDLVEDLPYDETTRAYLACQIELDRALAYLLEQLEEKGIADHTVIALSADHYPYGLTVEEMSILDGNDLSVDFEMYKNSFLLYCAGMEETIEIDKLGSSLDIAPTLCNLFNLPYDSRLYMGRDILSDADPLIIMSDHSFFNDKMLYNASTGEIKFYGEEYPQSYVDTWTNQVNDKFTMSTAVLDYDYYSYLKDYLPWWDGESYGHLYDPATEEISVTEESSALKEASGEEESMDTAMEGES
ncbi:MAG: LTA synthase family protein [Lachnospirales bacterium]